MAEATSGIHAELERLIECPVCFESFTDPIALPCMHTFCAKCIKQYVDMSEKDKDETRKFNCPTCRRHVDIPEGGAERLPKNLFVNNLKEVIASTKSTQSSCEYCVALGADAIARWRCVECCHSICDQCKVAHDRVHILSTPHQVVEIDKWKDSDLSTICNQNKEICPDHQNKPMEFYCSVCDLAICQNCHTLNHSSHRCEDLNKIADQMKIAIQQQIAHIARLMKTREAQIQDLRDCRERVTSSSSDVSATIRQLKTTCQQLVTECFDDIEKKAGEISGESCKIIDMNLDSLHVDIASLLTSTQMGDAVRIYGRKAEIVETTKRLKDIISSQEEAAIDIDNIKKYLSIMTFKANEIKTFICQERFGLCEKSPLFPDLHNRADEAVREPARERPTPSVSKIRKQPVVIKRVDVENYQDVTAASTGDTIAARDDRVCVYDQAGEYMRDFTRPDGIRKWSPLRVNAYSDGERAVVVVTNDCSRADGGGAYVFAEDGRYTGESVFVDRPRNAAALDDCRIAVLRYDGVERCRRLEVYDIKTNKLLSSVVFETNQLAYRDWSYNISVSPVTREVIVSHDAGVTAFSSADLALRWEYGLREDGAGQLSIPWGVCVDQAGRVFVSDALTGRVVVLSEVGECVTALSTGGFMKDGPYELTLTRHGQLVMGGHDHNGKLLVFITEYLE